jgi:cytoskeletal protein CcmA (bactofilin family)
VDGDIISPRVAIAEGAHFRGSVDMQRAGAKAAVQPKAAEPPKPAASAAPAQQPAQKVGV